MKSEHCPESAIIKTETLYEINLDNTGNQKVGIGSGKKLGRHTSLGYKPILKKAWESS